MSEQGGPTTAEGEHYRYLHGACQVCEEDKGLGR